MNSLGRNVHMSDQTTLGERVVIGHNVTFRGAVEVGDDTTILDGAVLGRPPLTTGNTTRELAAALPALRIGPSCIIGANAVLYTGTTLGASVMIGDLASLREGCRLADQVVIGRGVLVMYQAVVGARSRIIDGAIVTGHMTIEEDVFIGPGANSINDNEIYLKRFGLVAPAWHGPVVRRFAVVGASATLAAAVVVGEGALVAPGAMVVRDVPAWTLVAGVPATERRPVPEQERRSILERFGIQGP